MGGSVSFPSVSLSDKRVFIVTGGNGGIGYEVSKWIAMMGGTVIVASRSQEKSLEAIRKMNEEYKELKAAGTEGLVDVDELKLEFMKLDLASFQSIKDFSESFKQSGRQLHVLVCNAGLVKATFSQTEDGFESTFQVNYLGHFLLIGQLLPLMKTMEDEDLRIVLVSGDIYRIYSFDIDKLNYEGPADKFPSNASYGRSKMYQIMQMYSMHRRLANSKVSITSLHPGVVDTGLMRESQDSRFRQLAMGAVRSLGILITPKEGSKCVVYAAVSPDMRGRGGVYLKGCKDANPNSTARDETKQDQLWAKTMEYLKGHLTEEEIRCLEGDKQAVTR